MLTSSTLFIGDDNGTIENLGDSEKDRACAWLDNTIGNNSVVSERKEKISLSQPTPSLFWRHFVSRCRGNRQLVNHFIMNVPGIVAQCKRLGIRIGFLCKSQLIRIL